MSFLEACSGEIRRDRIRFLRNLSIPDALVVRKADTGQVLWRLVKRARETKTSWSEPLVRDALACGVVNQEADGACRISRVGRMALRRALSGADAHADQHREINHMSPTEKAVSEVRSGAVSLKINLNESPLAKLAARRCKDGRPLLKPEEVRAGERLRADYTFAAMMPAIGQGWRVERTGSGPGQNGQKDLNDDVLSARQRVERILTSMEPVLAGVLVDVCCHLKGLEKIEAERGWPARCAKIVLQIGLSALADRYGERSQAPSANGQIQSWTSR